MEKVEQLIERFAAIQGITVEEAKEQIGAQTENEVLDNITKFTLDKINKNELHLNRKQRRALMKKSKRSNKAVSPQEQMDVINDTAKKLNYIDLIQKLRALNEQKAKENEENGETTTENN